MNEQFNGQPFNANGVNEQQWQAQQPQYEQPPQPQQYGQPYVPPQQTQQMPQPQQPAQPKNIGFIFAKTGFILGIIAIALVIQTFLTSAIAVSIDASPYISSDHIIIFSILLYLCYIMVAMQAIFSTIGLIKMIFVKDIKGIIFASVGIVLAIISAIICGNVIF